jgi:hypothetical protein
MTQARSTAQQELEARLVARAWQEEGFKQQLLTDPRAAIAAETGGNVPEGIEVRVVEETPTVRYLVLPLNTTQLSDEQLDRTAGGNSAQLTDGGQFASCAKLTY